MAESKQKARAASRRVKQISRVDRGTNLHVSERRDPYVVASGLLEQLFQRRGRDLHGDCIGVGKAARLHMIFSPTASSTRVASACAP